MIARGACVLLALAALAGCAAQPLTASDARVAFAGPSEQYVVVTVRNPAALLPRAGSTLRDYDVPSSYGASPAARREVRALAAAHGLVEVEGWPIAALGVHCVVFKLPSGVAGAEALRQLQRDRRVESVQPLNTFSTLSATTSDPYRALQRNLDAMHVAQAHAWSRGENVRIAVVDTGMDAAHPDLSGRIVLQRNFVDESTTLAPERHGTAIAGVIAAIDNNREGIAGIAPAASLVGLKACWQHDDASAAVCNTFTLAKALAAAVDAQSHVVNLSLAGPPDPLLQRLVDYGAKRGVIYVGALPKGEVGFPCNVASVICVGSAGQWSHAPRLFAPGSEVLTLVPGGRYDFVSGSSLAAASVSAGIALLRAREPGLTAESAVRLLASSAHSVANDQAPSIDVCRALSRLLHTTGCPN